MPLRRHSTVLALLAAGCLSFPAWAASPQPKQALTRDAEQLREWVVRSQDNEGLPFMIVDKRQARLWVFDRAAQLQGDSPVLLGSARGDHSLPGIGDMPLSQIKPSDRTTPAGRFKAEVGRNMRGEDVLWVDYDGGVSMHPVLTTKAAERRAERLATRTPADNRVSYGCINVPKTFHESVVLGSVKHGHGIVYVLPETSQLRSVFKQLAATAAVAPTSLARE
ncbi:MAG: L,D-transpeptidase [Burkholderiaceae bacterium]